MNKESKIIKPILVNIWQKHAEGHWAVITTNGVVTPSGDNVMGAGVALEAKERFSEMPRKLGAILQKHGNNVFVFPEYRLITFPTKDHYKDPSKIDLIKRGMGQLFDLINDHNELAIEKIYCPLLGCGYGGLNWENQVSPEIYLDYLRFNGRLIFVTNR